MKRIDIQVNGGSGLLFNNITTLNDFLKIELNHLKYGKTFIIPTFITDSNENLKRFVKIILERISYNEKKYSIENNTIILPKLWGIHIEGPFITNKGTHPERHIKDLNEENVNTIIEILKPLKNLPIIITIAPELILKDIKNRIKLIEKLKNELNITISAGHTKITEEDFKKLQNELGKNKYTQLTHLHNAMFGGHFKGDDDGIPTYLMNNDFKGFFGFITDGQHTSNGELLPTLLNYHDKICIISDCASPACCKITNNNNLFRMGDSIGVVEQKKNELPSFFWTDFLKNPSDEIKNKKISLEELYKMYIKGEGGYKTLAGSAVNLDQCYFFLKNFDIEKEIQKSKNNKKTKKLLEIGLEKNKITEKDIRSFIDKNLDKMLFDNPVKAINIDRDIENYFIDNNGLYKNNELFIDFNDEIYNFLDQTIEDQNELKNELFDELKVFLSGN